MGQVLDKPVIDKETHTGGNSFLKYGCSAMQGYRVSMEDAHSTDDEITFPEKLQTLIGKDGTLVSFFGVYDGHSGEGCAKFLASKLLKKLLEQEQIGENNDIFGDDSKIEEAFINTDIEFETRSGENDSGSTATTVIFKKKGDKIEAICANTGDSRSILYNDGETQALSIDHKPQREEEKNRIKNAGGYIEFGRVNGTLAVSRAFGDLLYKDNKQKSKREQAVTALPEIRRLQVKESGERFAVLACDGVWDVMKNEEVSKFVAQRLKDQKSGDYWEKKGKEGKLSQEEVQKKSNSIDLGMICEDLLDYVVLDLDSKDNVSAIIVLFN